MLADDFYIFIFFPLFSSLLGMIISCDLPVVLVPGVPEDIRGAYFLLTHRYAQVIYHTIYFFGPYFRVGWA